MEARNLFERFDMEVNVEGLKSDLSNVGTEDRYREVPVGNTYNVKVDKLQLVESRNGKPMVSCWFKIIEGPFKNSVLFMNQVVNTGYGLHMANEFLRSLESQVEIKFENFKQYHNMILDIHEAVDNLEYSVEYGEKKGFKTFKITEVYEGF